MSKLKPYNDYLLVEHITDEQASGGLVKVGGTDPEEGIRKGRVIDISKNLAYWGSHTYYFDSSAMNDKMLEDVAKFYSDLVGKVVYWPERSESGAIIEHEGNKYILMKFASIMAVEEDE